MQYYFCFLLALCLVGFSIEGIIFLSQEECENSCNGADEACQKILDLSAWQCTTDKGLVKRIIEGSGRLRKRCVREDACASQPCDNGGTCFRKCLPPGYFCTCAAGFTGPNCTQVDSCAPGPCQNNGTCINDDSSYECECPSGFTGTNCETIQPADPCDPDPCTGAGASFCSRDGSTFLCVCNRPWKGQLCDECFKPCQNGGTCLNGFDSCDCPTGFSGPQCQIVM